ncbi:MAG: ATP-binding protein, partial [Anaerolineae bacterium]
LLLHRREPLPRAHVAYTLWPDTPEDASRKQLRRHLHILQQLLPDAPADRQWIVSEKTTVQWNPDGDYWLDVEQFERLCGSDRASGGLGSGPSGHRRGPDTSLNDLERAVAIYAGDLLVELYDDWILVERERLRREYEAALTSLLALQATHGDLHATIASAERLLAHDAFREEHHRLVIGLRYLAGDRAAALKAYERCRAVIAEEFELEPLPETEQLASDIRAGEPEIVVARRLRSDLPEVIDLAGALHEQVPSNLPSAQTDFVGRERELSEVTRLLGDQRLVTLTGPPGGGKSRLALETASRLRARSEQLLDFPATDASEAHARPEPDGPACRDGVWWVDLAALDHASEVVEATCAAIQVPIEHGQDAAAALEEFARHRELLLVLDNTEHVAASCAELVARLLNAGASLRALVTGRQPLGVAGERSWPVPPMACPDAAQDHSIGIVAASEAVQLLAQRAQAISASFEVTADNAATVARLCRRLDGNPLALELAAGRLRDLSVAEVINRLGDRFDLLRDRAGSLDPHHATLATAIDTSHDFLPDREKALFRRLSAFRGGWTLHAAEEVCSGGEVPRDEVLDLLAALVDKSLVEVRAQRGARRYRMSRTIRGYAADKLAVADDAAAVRESHLEHFLQLAEAAAPHMVSEAREPWLSSLEGEHANLQAALEWATGAVGQLPRAQRLAVALRPFWALRGYHAVAVRLLGPLLEAQQAEPPSLLKARVLYAAGSAACWDPAGTSGGPRLCDPEWLLTSAREMAEEFGDRQLQAWALNDLGIVACRRQDYPLAIQRYEASLELKRALGETWDVVRSMVNLAEMAWRAGDYDRCEELHLEALDECRRGSFEDPMLEGAIAGNLAEVAYCRGDYARAGKMYGEALAELYGAGERVNITLSLAGTGAVAAQQKHPRRGARLLAAAEAHRERTGMALDEANAAMHESMVAVARAQLAGHVWEAAVAEGRAMTLDEAVAYALSDDDPGSADRPESAG